MVAKYESSESCSSLNDDIDTTDTTTKMILWLILLMMR
jgi:hypothetical protein